MIKSSEPNLLHMHPSGSSLKHLNLNSAPLLPLLSGTQSVGIMLEVNQIPVMVLTSVWGQGLWLEGARQSQPIG